MSNFNWNQPISQGYSRQIQIQNGNQFMQRSDTVTYTLTINTNSDRSEGNQQSNLNMNNLQNFVNNIFFNHIPNPETIGNNNNWNFSNNQMQQTIENNNNNWNFNNNNNNNQMLETISNTNNFTPMNINHQQSPIFPNGYQTTVTYEPKTFQQQFQRNGENYLQEWKQELERRANVGPITTEGRRRRPKMFGLHFSENSKTEINCNRMTTNPFGENQVIEGEPEDKTIITQSEDRFFLYQ